MSELPHDDWKQMTLGSIGKWGSGGTPKSNEQSYYDGDIPWIRSGDLPDGEIIEHNESISETGLHNSAAKWITERALLIALYGATIGKLGKTTYPVTTNQAVAYCIPDASLSSVDFLFWYLLHIRPELIALGQGGAQPNISQTILKQHQILLPPLDEQRRIVAKLDALFAHSTAARAALAHVPRLVERTRQAVLAAAFSGKLSSDDAANWPVRPLQKFASLQLGKMLDRAKNKGQMRPYIRNVNVRWFSFDLEDLSEMPFTESEEIKLSIRDGDIMVCEGGEPGRAAIWQGGDSSIKYQKALHRIRLPKDFKPEWIVYQLAYKAVSGELLNHFTGTTIKHLPQEALGSILFLIPSGHTQSLIVARIEAAFARIDLLAAEARRAAALLDRLEQATLAKAFRGEL